MNQQQEQKGLYIHISKELHKKIKAKAVSEETTMRDIVLTAIQQYLNKERCIWS